MSRHSRKRFYRRRKRRATTITRLLHECNRIGPGMTREIITKVFDRNAAAILLQGRWRVDEFLSPGVLAVLKEEPRWFFSREARPFEIDRTSDFDVRKLYLH